MNIHTPSQPRHLRITQTMMEDLVWDVVLAAKVLMGYELDVFQRVRLRLKWLVPFLVDSSGFTSGKTEENFVLCNLRNLLLPDQEGGVYYPRFETGKQTFWAKFGKCRHPIFRAQLGNEDLGKDRGTEGAACYTMFYQNGNKLLMPAPDFARKALGQASLRFNFLLIDEYVMVDDSEKGRQAIDEQLSGRVTRESWNKHHPIWCNHILFTAPARTQLNPSYRRPRDHERQAAKGNPDFEHLSGFCFKDYSNLPTSTGRSYRDRFRDDKIIKQRVATMDSANVLGDIFGVWAKSGKGWYNEETLLQLMELGRLVDLEPMLTATDGV